MPHAFFSSWSGGKDSCLALLRAVRAGHEPKLLVTMLIEDGERSRSHGLAAGVLRAQAAALGLPIVFRATSWDGYEASFLDALRGLKAFGVDAGVFGDIDIQGHREWVERVCGQAGMAPLEPLWGGARRELLHEFMAAGFRARIVAVREAALGPQYLGRTLDAELVSEFEALGIDASGEQGEYHTVVTGGPLFSAPVELEEKGRVLRSGCWFLDLAVASG